MSFTPRRFTGPLARLSLTITLTALACAVVLLPTAGPARAATVPPIKHVFVIVEENESAATTFGAGSPAPYLAKTLTSEGAYVPNYYGIGHSSLDNYIAMVSGQAPNMSTSADCGTFTEFPAPQSMTSPYGQENGQGCIYPTNVATLMGQLQGAGLSWRAYEDGMPSPCVHPTSGGADTNNGEEAGEYATRHNPFVYFHSVIDNASACAADDVPLSQLPTDLTSAATTPNYVFITPNVCDDGHDATCANGGPGGLGQADTFLRTWVPMITSSPAYQQNGLLMIIFDEAASSDTSACCGEIAGPGELLPGGTGPGGGDTGAVFLSPYIAAGTVTQTAYNHYSMLASVEDIFGLPHIGYAQLPGETDFGNDIFTQPNGPVTTTPTTTTPVTTPTTTTPVTTPTTPTPKPATPHDSGLKLSPATFAPTGTRGRHHHGTVISYSDTQAGVSTLTVSRLAAGYRRGRGTCHALSPRHRVPKGARSCLLTRQVGRVTHQDHKGANRVVFTGRLNGRALAAGTYTLTVRPKLGSLGGTTLSLRFRVI